MKNLIMNNLGLKISAVLISISLWLVVTSRGQSEISFDVPVEFTNIPAELEIVNNIARTVNVTIKGQERAVRNVKAMDIRAFMDMSKAKKGEGSYYINKDDIKLPYAGTVENVTPSMLKIRLDETFEKVVDIKTILTGQPEEGFRVKAIITEPAKVKIKGIKSEVIKIRELQTEALDITGFNKTVLQELNIDLSNKHVRPDIATVKVKIQIGKKK